MIGATHRSSTRAGAGRSRWRLDSITNSVSWRSSSGPARRAAISASAATSTSSGGSCALGAVYDGVYHLPRDHGKLIPDHLERLFRCLDEVTKRCPRRLRQAAAAGGHDRAPERRPSSDARTDRRVAHTRKQRIASPCLSSTASSLNPGGSTPTPTVRAAAVSRAARPTTRATAPRPERAGGGRRHPRPARGAGRGSASVEELVRLARSEPDEDTRRGLVERLVGIATAAADRDGDAAQALDAPRPTRNSWPPSRRARPSTRCGRRPSDGCTTSASGQHRAPRRRPADRPGRRRPGAGSGGAPEHRTQDRTQGRRARGARPPGGRRGTRREPQHARTGGESREEQVGFQAGADHDSRHRRSGSAGASALEQWRQQDRRRGRPRDGARPRHRSGPTRACSWPTRRPTWLALSGTGSFAVDPETARATTRPSARREAPSNDWTRSCRGARRGGAPCRSARGEGNPVRADRGGLGRRRARRGRERARRSGKAWRPRTRCRRATPTCTRASTRRAAAPPSATPTGRRSKRRAVVSKAVAQEAEAARAADPFDERVARRDREWASLVRLTETVDPALVAQRFAGAEATRRPARGGEAGRRGARRPAAGAAARAADRARRRARRRRGPDHPRSRPARRATSARQSTRRQRQPRRRRFPSASATS